MDELEDIIRRILLDALRPTDKGMDRSLTTEKMAYIELHEDVLEEAYDMSKEIKEYD